MRPHRVILADPAWEYRNRHEVRSDNPEKKTRFGIGVASRYNHGVMNVSDIAAMQVASVAAPDAYLFLWCTWPNLREGLRVMDAWGFEYKTCGFDWIKTYPSGEKDFVGTGRYVPSNSEPCLFGIRKGGKPWHPNTGSKPNQVIRCPHPRGDDNKIIHSRKPDDAHERIESWLGPHLGGFGLLELFATQPRAGWTCLGGDVTNRDIRIDLALVRHQISMGIVKERLSA